MRVCRDFGGARSAGGGPSNGGIQPAETGGAAGRRTAPRQGPVEGEPAAFAGKLYVAHVQSCPPADVLQLLLRVAGNSGPRGSSDSGAGDGYGKDTVPAGVRRRNAAGPSGWAEDSARTAGLLRPSIGGAF